MRLDSKPGNIVYLFFRKGKDKGAKEKGNFCPETPSKEKETTWKGGDGKWT